MEDNVFYILLRIVAERKEALSRYLATGGASDYNKYSHMTGQFAELEAMEEEIKTLEKRMMDQ